jgi:hypothetical protein
MVGVWEAEEVAVLVTPIERKRTGNEGVAWARLRYGEGYEM